MKPNTFEIIPTGNASVDHLLHVNYCCWNCNQRLKGISENTMLRPYKSASQTLAKSSLAWVDQELTTWTYDVIVNTEALGKLEELNGNPVGRMEIRDTLTNERSKLLTARRALRDAGEKLRERLSWETGAAVLRVRDRRIVRGVQSQFRGGTSALNAKVGYRPIEITQCGGPTWRNANSG